MSAEIRRLLEAAHILLAEAKRCRDDNERASERKLRYLDEVVLVELEALLPPPGPDAPPTPSVEPHQLARMLNELADAQEAHQEFPRHWTYDHRESVLRNSAKALRAAPSVMQEDRGAESGMRQDDNGNTVYIYDKRPCPVTQKACFDSACAQSCRRIAAPSVPLCGPCSCNNLKTPLKHDDVCGDCYQSALRSIAEGEDEIARLSRFAALEAAAPSVTALVQQLRFIEAAHILLAEAKRCREDGREDVAERKLRYLDAVVLVELEAALKGVPLVMKDEDLARVEPGATMPSTGSTAKTAHGDK